MEDVDEETVKFLHHHLKIWGFGRSPMVFGVWEGVLGEGGRFLEPAFLPWNSGPQYYGGADPKRAILLVAARVSSRKFPPKFKLSTWAIWSAFTAKISNSSTKQMCAESGFGALQESARATLPVKCW